MIKWETNPHHEPELANIEARRAIAERLDSLVNFIKYASVGGMVMTAVYFGLKIYGVM